MTGNAQSFFLSSKLSMPIVEVLSVYHRRRNYVK